MSHPTAYTLDETKIRSLLIRERYYRDTSQWQKMRDSYHPDASKTSVKITWYDGDISGFIEQTAKITSAKVTTIHSLTPTEIEIRGRKALAESFCTTNSRFEHGGFEFDKLSNMRLVSRLEKLEESEDAPWKMLSLECIYIRDSIVPAYPLPSEAKPSFKDVENFRSSYRFGSWLLHSIGLEVSNDLPGEDRRESVEEVFTRNREWIQTP